MHRSTSNTHTCIYILVTSLLPTEECTVYTFSSTWNYRPAERVEEGNHSFIIVLERIWTSWSTPGYKISHTKKTKQNKTKGQAFIYFLIWKQVMTWCSFPDLPVEHHFYHVRLNVVASLYSKESQSLCVHKQWRNQIDINVSLPTWTMLLKTQRLKPLWVYPIRSIASQVKYMNKNKT